MFFKDVGRISVQTLLDNDSTVLISVAVYDQAIPCFLKTQ